jgi:hypothetical protein
LFKQNSISAYDDIYKIFFKNLIVEKFITPDEIRKMKKYEINKYEIDFLKEKTANHNILMLDILNDYQMKSFRVSV